MRQFCWLLPLSFLLALPPSLASQQAPPTVAVLDFTAFSLTLEDAASVGKGVAGMMITELSGRPGLRVIERQQLQSLLQEQKLVLSGRAEEQALQIGKLLGAQYVFTGNVALTPKEARLDVRVTSVETSAIIRSDKLRGKPDDLLDMVVKIADQFTNELKLEAPKRVTTAAIPLQATIAYSRGVDYEDKKQFDKAAEMYRKALELAPEYKDAKEGLERVTRAKGGQP
ncbi:MAG: tetratricopeptide repeat protein [Gemmatimonadetes bacterium]|nr:tetratricopeptide repeat protein [Gemmatimonadota bacterium]